MMRASWTREKCEVCDDELQIVIVVRIAWDAAAAVDAE